MMNTTQGHLTCPNCRSDAWKSAKLVVLEGTSFTDGELAGTVTDPGAFSGGMKEFLLSDRWFSWDYKLEASIGLTTRSGLVDEVKRMMTTHSEVVEMPSEPIKPKEISAFARIRPNKPTEPAEPEEPVTKTWRYFFRESMNTLLGSLILLALIAYFGFDDVKKQYDNFTEYFLMFCGVVVVVSVPILFFRSFSGNRREKLAYEEAVEKHPERVAEYKTAFERYQLDCDRAEVQQEDEKRALALYELQVRQHAEGRQRVLMAREHLWNTARVCMRCGSAYLGSSQWLTP